MFHMALVAAVALSIVVPSTTGITLPITTSGWFGALGVILLQGCSIPLYYAALPKIGAETSSILNNLQPATSITAAYLLFGEALTPAQGIGAVMVIGGILAMQVSNRLARRRSLGL
jgi:drug/metabolite transporter (DMT)-like permease